MPTHYQRIALAIFFPAVVFAKAAYAEPGHPGNIDTIGIETGMAYDEVKAAMSKVKSSWKESPLRPTPRSEK